MQRKQRSYKRMKLDARKSRVRKRLSRMDRHRLTVYRTSKHIYAQLIDPETGRTVTSVSTRSPRVRDGLQSTANVEAARRVGQTIAEVARERRIEEVVFNRNGFLFHGRIKALADAAREAGLRF
jgi:large subunit ribosomal protein L18